MDLNKLKIFYYVAKAGSFTNNDLHLSSSVISRHISDLEYRQKTKLFYRHPRKLILTPEGQLLYQSACRIMKEIEHVQLVIQDSVTGNQPQGLLTIYIPTMWTNIIFTKYAVNFMRLYPDVRLNVTNKNYDIATHLKDYQIAILPYRPNIPNLIAERITTFDLVLYASANYIRAHGYPKKMEDLNKHRLLAYGDHEQHTNDINWHLKLGCKMDNLRKPHLRICNLSHAVVQHLGIAPLVKDCPIVKSHNLVHVLPNIEGLKIDIFMVFPEHMKNCSTVNLFINSIMKPHEKTKKVDNHIS